MASTGWARRLLFSGAILGVVLLAYFGLRANAWHAQTLECQRRLRLLTLAMSLYLEDSDHLMPPRPPVGGDWVASQWGARPAWPGAHGAYRARPDRLGPLSNLMEDISLARCPADPDYRRRSYEAVAHSSYEWNLRLAGKRADDVIGQPLVWDKLPWHRDSRTRGRNMCAFWGGLRGPAPYWLPESEFQALLQAQVIPAAR